ncbi:MAG TPA: DUF3126 domain-containing protein [Rhodospirillaceae bacterium]|jgi:hypothetical protein|nr:DUF3126 family protein [Alphaproteobacteria bacterium]HBH26003.1 DUF3126 domain-containing protein [Rhodospirillaceae bacterium]
MATLAAEEVPALQRYMETLFGAGRVALKLRGPSAPDSAEVLVAGEFIGVVYKNTEEGETSYDLTISILEEDL